MIDEAVSSATTETDCATEVLGLLRRQADLYRRLQSLAERQRRAVRAAETAPLLGLLADRQKLTDELSRISGQLAHSRDNWEAVRRQMSEEQRRSADALLRESGRRVEQILEGDEADARMLSARKNRTAEAVSSARTAGRMLAAYGRTTPPNATHLDRTDEES